MENTLLVEAHMDLVKGMAMSLMKNNQNCYWLNENDLIGAGYEALLAASKAYDASRNVSFSTYASKCIRNAMLAEIRNMFPVKVYDSQLRPELVRSDEIEDEDELAELFGHWESEHHRLMETVAELMTHLSHDERWLIRCYYGFDDEPMTLQGIANLLSVSPQAVHKRLMKIHDKLRRLVVDSHPYYRMCA